MPLHKPFLTWRTPMGAASALLNKPEFVSAWTPNMSMDTEHEFVAWATSPERTLEEAYCAERLVELGLETWRTRHESTGGTSWEARRDYQKRRRLNPAHRVRISAEEARRGYAGLLEVDGLDLSAFEDRPLRDVSGLRFFSHLKTLSMHQNEVTDLGPLSGLRQLHHLSVSDAALEDLAPVGALTSLKQLWIRVRLPWPKAAALGALENLEDFQWAGNLLALEEIPRLSRVRKAEFCSGLQSSLPVRDCTRLPDMPWLESLKLDGVYALDGITRWPRLRNLIVGGLFRDLHPLTGLRQLTHLQLEGDVTRELSPLVQLTQLRRLVVHGTHPQDYSVLAEARRLHEVMAEGCRINEMELSTLHAVLPKWDEEFETDTPRIPGRLVFESILHESLPEHPRAALGAEACWEGDAAMAASEARWMRLRLGSALGRLLGRGWGEVLEWGTGPGQVALRIFSMDAAERLAEVVDRTRAVLASGRWPWLAHLTVDLGGISAGDEPDEELSEEEEVRRELEDYRCFKRRREEEQVILEREHRLRLLQQEGRAVDPRTFATEGTGALALEEEESPAIDYAVEERTHPLAEELFVIGTITVEGFFVSEPCRRAAEHLMRRAVDTKPS